MSNTMTLPPVEKFPLTNAQKEVIRLTADQVVQASRVPGQRMSIHGWNPEGDIDVEFPNFWAAMDWATEYHVRAVVDVRDAGVEGHTQRSLTDTCVLTFNLWDYALAQVRRGTPVPGTATLFV